MINPDSYKQLVAMREKLRDSVSDRLAKILDKIRSCLIPPELSGNQVDIEINHIVELIYQKKNRYKFHDKWKSELIRNADDNEEEKKSIEDIERFIYNLNDLAMYYLREERIDETNKPFVLCIDEYSDAEVLEKASKEERKRASLIAIERCLSHSYYRPYYSIENKKYKKDLSSLDSFVVAVICHGLIFGQLSIEEIQVFAAKKLLEHRNLDFKNATELKEVALKVIKKYHQLINSEVPEKEQFTDLTEIITNQGLSFQIDNQSFEMPSEHGSFLDEDSKNIIQPLLKANKISRQEMILAAKEFAKKHLGANELELENNTPPSWFTEGCSGDRGIISREILVYIPRNIGDIPVNGKVDLNRILGQNKDEPNIISFIRELANDEEYRSTGWHTMRLSDSSAPCVVATNKLTS
jgi:hypothetical protein